MGYIINEVRILLQLKNEFPSIIKSGTVTFGGSQMLSENDSMKRCGCGIIAAADMLIFLANSREDCAVGPAAEFMPCTEIHHSKYERFCKHLRNGYLPIIPPIGMNGLTLAIGLNIYFLRWKLPFRAAWGISQAKIWDRIEEMLKNNIPVIFAVGPNFPFVWQNNRLNFYQLRNGEYIKANSAKAHYVSLVGMDALWLRISSWGREYFIRRDEFNHYVRHFSQGILSNILYVTEK